MESRNCHVTLKRRRADRTRRTMMQGGKSTQDRSLLRGSREKGKDRGARTPGETDRLKAAASEDKDVISANEREGSEKARQPTAKDKKKLRASGWGSQDDPSNNAGRGVTLS